MLLDLTIIIAAAFTGGAVTKLLDWALSRRQNSTNYWYGEVERLLEADEKQQSRIARLEETVGSLKEQADNWRRRYYREQREREEDRHQFLMSLSVLRSNPDVKPADIDRLYQTIFREANDAAAQACT